jgi:phosphatidate cytidylyltransferase
MLATRAATALVLLAIFVSSLLFLPNHWWAGLLLALLIAAGWEWGGLAGWGRAARWGYGGLLASCAALLWLAASAPLAVPGRAPTAVETAVYGAGCAFWLLIAAPWLVRAWCVRSPLLLAAAGLAALLPSWLALARLQLEPERLLVVLGVVWLADTAAYLVGSRWGRHKLAPAVSPGKSWEGLAAAVAAVAVYYGVLYGTGAGWASAMGAVLIAVVTLTSVLGDLFESWLKRQAGVKDSGTWLPGHGGVLDRADSLTASLPFAASILPFLD